MDCFDEYIIGASPSSKRSKASHTSIIAGSTTAVTSYLPARNGALDPRQLLKKAMMGCHWTESPGKTHS